MRDSAMIYRNQVEALRQLPPEQFKHVVTTLWDYELDGVIPEGDPVAFAIWKMAQPLIDKRTKNYENGVLGGRPKNRPETEPKPTENRIEPNDNLKDKEERINIKEIPTCVGTKKSGITPPTLQEVKDYVMEKGYNMDAERFVDFYESKGWMVGKNKMKDWKAAVRNWARGQRQGTTAKAGQGLTANRFNNFKQRQYDRDELERRLLRAQGVSG